MSTISQTTDDDEMESLNKEQQPIWISELRVSNYRSIKDETFRFGPSCNILIGHNNSGKSTILEAISLVLTTTNTGLVMSNFHYPRKDVVIELTLEGIDDQALRHYGCSPTIPVILKATWRKPSEQLRTSSLAVREIKASTRFGEIKDATGFLNDLCDTMQFTYLEEGRDHESLAKEYQQSSLYALLSAFVQPSTLLTAQSSGSLQEAVEWLNKGLLDSSFTRGDAEMQVGQALIEQCREFAELDQQLRSILSEAGVEIRRIAIRPLPFAFHKRPPAGKYDIPSLLKLLQLEVEDAREASPQLYSVDGRPNTFLHTPLRQHGSGMQSALTIAIARLLVSKRHVQAIYGIEEPELGLHPHSQRSLTRMLSRMADQQQVILTTHSPQVADLWWQRHLQDRIVMVVKRRGATTARSVGRNSPHAGDRLSSEDYNLLERLLANTGSEMLFADGVIIVEGPTEAGMIPAVAATLNYELDQRSITVIKAGGKGRVPALLRMCRSLAIPHYAIMDFDAIISKNGKLTYEKLPGLNKNDLASVKAITVKLKSTSHSAQIVVPSRTELGQINAVLSRANCIVLSQDAEHVFAQGIQAPYRPCYEVRDELYDTRIAADWLPYNTPSLQDVISTLKDSKDEVYWRTMIERWSQSGLTWLNPEIEQVLQVVFSSLNDQRQQLANLGVQNHSAE